QNGTKIIGSGNLDYSISSNSNDEVGELSQAFNQMTANLKTVTASKTDLEYEMVGRKQAEASLRESEQRWATTLSSIGDAVIATDVAGSITFMNAVAEKLTGWTLREVLGKPLKDVFHLINEETHLEVESPVTKVLEKGMIVGLANHTILVRKDGSEVPLDDSGAPIKDELGNVAGVVLVFHDIFERKIMEKKLEEYQKHLEDLVETRSLSLKESEEKYRTLFDSIDEGFCIIEMVFDPEYRPLDYRFLEVNASFERQTGMHEAKGKLMRSFAPNHEAYWFEIYGKVALTGQPVRFTNEAKALSRYYDVYAFPVGEEKIRKVGILFNDISVRMNLEKQLKNSERLATIGATAGMVGHDIRNPLQAITSDVFLARSELASFPESEEKKNTIESLDEIEKNIDYINKIVQDLQDYARPLNPQAEEADMKQIITKLIAKNPPPDNITVTVKVEEETQKISADSYYINRIMYNLVTNAVQAMPNGGKLTIRAYKDSNDLVIAVKDTGVGIPKEIQGKMFTPMFTTKSKGQGFGLPVVKRMTEALGGTVTFESQEGKGTTFEVRLPPKS
ncbi:MAG: ATP-binding protein, partial [Candidatus Bathyarchaeia archaeon]